MARIAYLVSSAQDTEHPTGYWAEQALTSYELLMAAGAEVVVLTPDGRPPVVDPCSLDPVFHHPDEDRAYYASVCRTFQPDSEDIRLTLQHSTQLELVAARRIAHRLVMAGMTSDGAHQLVSSAARIAWQQNRKLVEVMLTEGLDGGLPENPLRGAVDELRIVSQALADDRSGCLDDLDGFRTPRALSGARLDEFDGLFAPGGHGATIDLPSSPEVARLLAVLHAKQAPIAVLSQATALLLAAPDRLDGQWLFEGYRLTSCTNEEEDQLGHDRDWYVADALQNAGAILDDAPTAWVSHVVVDRCLITGQNLYSTRATAGALLEALRLR